MSDDAAVEALALAFIREEASFAQVTSVDAHGFPVGRSMTAFVRDDFSVDLVQRRSHKRLQQLRRNPRVLITWVGEPAAAATNERPHVFDIGRLPSRAVFIRGTAHFMDDEWTKDCYRRHLDEQRAQGFTRAPRRDADQVAEELVGLHVVPYRVRLEGFGEGAQAFDWTVIAVDDPRHEPTRGER